MKTIQDLEYELCKYKNDTKWKERQKELRVMIAKAKYL